MSEEFDCPESVRKYAINRRREAAKYLQNALKDRADAQVEIEQHRKEHDELADWLGPDSVPDEEAEYAAKAEREHALKFADLMRPLAVWPARGITLTITHPDAAITAHPFYLYLQEALKAFADYQAEVEAGTASNPPPEPRYPYTAPNGVRIEVQSHASLTPEEIKAQGIE